MIKRYGNPAARFRECRPRPAKKTHHSQPAQHALECPADTRHMVPPRFGCQFGTIWKANLLRDYGIFAWQGLKGMATGRTSDPARKTWRWQADGEHARGRKRSYVCALHRLPVPCDPQRPAAENHSLRLFRSVDL